MDGGNQNESEHRMRVPGSETCSFGAYEKLYMMQFCISEPRDYRKLRTLATGFILKPGCQNNAIL